MNLPIQVTTHLTNRPCVHPTRLINRDLSAAQSILREFRAKVNK